MQSHHHLTARHQGQVGPVHDEIEQPVADHQRTQHQRPEPFPPQQEIAAAEQDGPDRDGEQAVGNGTVFEQQGVTVVIPGMMLTRSRPRSSKVGHSRSMNCAARNSQPSATRGAMDLAAK